MFVINKSTKWLAIISTLLALYISLSVYLFTQDPFQTWLLILSPNSPLNSFFILVTLVSLSCIGLPRQVAAFTCGYFFEALWGFILATILVTVAAYITFSISKIFARSYVLSTYQLQLAKITTFLSNDTFSKAIIIRLLPIGSNFLTNVLAGVANIPLRPFLSGSFVGYIPQMFIFSLAGSGIKLAAADQITLSVILFLVAMLLSWQLYKKIPFSRQ